MLCSHTFPGSFVVKSQNRVDHVSLHTAAIDHSKGGAHDATIESKGSGACSCPCWP
jgi:hypothetical protein